MWTKKQQVVSLSSAENELYAAVKTASEGLGIQSVAKDQGIPCGLNLHLDASATMCFVNRKGLGKAKHVDMQNLWIQEASKSGSSRAKSHERKPSRLDDETAAKTEGRATHEYHGLRVPESWCRCVCEPQVVKMAGERVTSMLVVASTSASVSSQWRCRIRQCWQKLRKWRQGDDRGGSAGCFGLVGQESVGLSAEVFVGMVMNGSGASV